MTKTRLKKIYIEITNVCNLKCSFCSGCKRKSEFITVDNFAKIMHKISGHTNFVYLHILGEPLLHKDLSEILDICHENDIKASITTNGTLISSVDSEIGHKPALRQMNYSLHSLEEISLPEEEYMGNIFNFMENSKPELIHCFRIWNVESFEHDNSKLIKILANKFNVDENMFSLTKGNGIKLAENVYFQLDKKFFWPNINEDELFFNGKCYGLKNNIGILVDGTVVPCCLDSEGAINLGNIFESQLQDILEDERALKMLQGFRNNVLEEKLCRTCGFMQRLNSK